MLNSQRVAIISVSHVFGSIHGLNIWQTALCIFPGKMQRFRISLGSSGSGHGNFVLWALNQVGWRLKTPRPCCFCRVMCCQGGFNESRGIEVPWGSDQILSPIEIGDLPGKSVTPGGRRASPSSPTKGDARVRFFLRRSQNSENGNFGFKNLTHVNFHLSLDSFLRIWMKEKPDVTQVICGNLQAQEVAAQHAQHAQHVAGCRIFQMLT